MHSTSGSGNAVPFVNSTLLTHRKASPQPGNPAQQSLAVPLKLARERFRRIFEVDDAAMTISFSRGRRVQEQRPHHDDASGFNYAVMC
jgi:hypothetical protein